MLLQAYNVPVKIFILALIYINSQCSGQTITEGIANLSTYKLWKSDTPHLAPPRATSDTEEGSFIFDAAECTGCSLDAKELFFLTFPESVDTDLTSLITTSIVYPTVTLYEDGSAETELVTRIGEFVDDNNTAIARSGSVWRQFGVEL